MAQKNIKNAKKKINDFIDEQANPPMYRTFGSPAVDQVQDGMVQVNQSLSLSDQLRALRAQLEAGEISVTQWKSAAEPLAQQVARQSVDMMSSGQRNVDPGKQMLLDATKDTGFDFTGDWNANWDKRLKVSLPDQFKEDLRASVLPGNISEEERQRYLDEIPDNIDYTSDQFKSEMEGVRQRIQEEKAAQTEEGKRKQYISELSGLLTQNADRQFELDKPGMLEDLNARGLLHTSAVGDRYADRRKELAEGTSLQLAGADLDNKNALLDLYRNAGATQRGFQTGGLQREFGLEDYSRQFQDALRFARETQPQAPKGKSSGQQVGMAAAQGVSSYANARAGNPKGKG